MSKYVYPLIIPSLGLWVVFYVPAIITSRSLEDWKLIILDCPNIRTYIQIFFPPLVLAEKNGERRNNRLFGLFHIYHDIG